MPLYRLIVATVVLSFCWSTAVAKPPTLHVVLAADTADLTLSAAADLHNYQAFFRKIGTATSAALRFYWVAGPRFNAAALDRTLQSLSLHPDDAVFVALPSHGFNFGGRYPALPMQAGVGDSVVYLRAEELYARVGRLPCRLRVVLIDACNNIVTADNLAAPPAFVSGRGGGGPGGAYLGGAGLERRLRKLFLKTGGEFMVVSTEKDAIACQDAAGGYFTATFCAAFFQVVQSVEETTWPQVLHTLADRTAEFARKAGCRQEPQFHGDLDGRLFSSDDRAAAVPDDIRALMQYREAIQEKARRPISDFQELLARYLADARQGRAEALLARRPAFAALFLQALDAPVVDDLPDDWLRGPSTFVRLLDYLGALASHAADVDVAISFGLRQTPDGNFLPIEDRPDYYTTGWIVEKRILVRSSGRILRDTTVSQKFLVAFHCHTRRRSEPEFTDFRLYRIVDQPRQMLSTMPALIPEPGATMPPPPSDDLARRAAEVFQREAFARTRRLGTLIEAALAGTPPDSTVLDSMFYPRAADVYVGVSNLWRKGLAHVAAPDYFQRLSNVFGDDPGVRWKAALTDLSLLTERPEMRFLAGSWIWEGQVRFTQAFSARKSGYRDRTVKAVQVIVFPILRRDGSVERWEVRLGHVRVLETMPLGAAGEVRGKRP